MKNWMAMVLLLWAAAASGQDEPIGFKGLQLGASLAQFQLAFPDFQCRSGGPCRFDLQSDCIRKIAGPVDGAACGLRNTWAGVRVEKIYAKFDKSLLTDVYIVFRPQHFDAIVAAIAQRWGPPQSDKTETLRSRSGAEYTNRSMGWQRGGVLLLVRRYGKRADEGMAAIAGQERMAEAVKQAEEAVREGAKDL